MIAAVLSRADGASAVLHGGFVTYTKAHKTAALGISADLLRDKGAVNEEVVTQLATGALKRSPASFSLAVSGVLGPEEDEDGNPVGLVYFCCARSGAQPVVAKEEFGKQKPEQLLQLTIARAFDLIEDCVGRVPRFIGTAAARRTRHSSSVLDAFDRLHGRHAVTRLVRALEPP